MTIEILKQAVTACTNDIFFDFNEKRCGITSQVKNYIPIFQCWCGENVKEYKNIDDLVNDDFFDGKKLTEIINKLDISVT